MTDILPAILVQDASAPGTAPGSFSYRGRSINARGLVEAEGMIVVTPAGDTQALTFFPVKRDRDDGPAIVEPYWTWDGNVEHPTLTPAIDAFGGDTGGDGRTSWKGSLTAGMWVPAE